MHSFSRGMRHPFTHGKAFAQATLKALPRGEPETFEFWNVSNVGQSCQKIKYSNVLALLGETPCTGGKVEYTTFWLNKESVESVSIAHRNNDEDQGIQ